MANIWHANWLYMHVAVLKKIHSKIYGLSILKPLPNLHLGMNPL